MAVFDKWEFYADLTDIQTYLGYVRGNEVVEEYAAQLDAQYSADNDQKDVIFLNRCPDSSCRVPIPLKFAYPDEIEDKVFEALHKAWDTGTAWAAGIADYCDSLAGQITEPDTIAMAGAISDLQNGVVKKLDDIKDTEWDYLGGIDDQWQGTAKREFHNLKTHYSTQLDLWAQYAGNATLGFALSTALIAGHQQAVGKYVTSVRDGAKAMAQTWPDCKYGDTKTPEWITDSETIGKDVLDIFNGVKILKTVKDVIGKIGSAVDIIKTVAPKNKEQDFTAKTAEELYTQLTTSLYDDNLKPLQTALANLAAGNTPGAIALGDDLDAATYSSSSIRKALETKSADQWFLPDPGRKDLNSTGVTYPR